MRLQRLITRSALPLALAASLAGCAHTQPLPPLPPEGAVPHELAKVTLPDYVIEPPDVLRLEVLIREYQTDDPDAEKKELKDIKPKTDTKTGQKLFADRFRSVPLQPIFDDYTVRTDGSIFLGVYGDVKVAGYTLAQAAQAIRATLLRQILPEIGGVDPKALYLVLDVRSYNSKGFYVVFDGGGQGETLVRQQITGSETVLDALSVTNGLPPVSSKRQIWVARRSPKGGAEQILPVDWVAITQHGSTETNWQVMPGDRIYVKALPLVTFDNTLARVISPIDRLFGVALLGTSTVNQISGRGLTTGLR